MAFSGPFAEGPPSRALRVVAPSLTRFGWRELVPTHRELGDYLRLAGSLRRRSVSRGGAGR